MDNLASIFRFTVQNMAGCRVLSNSMMNIFILNCDLCPTRESDSDKLVLLCFGFAFRFMLRNKVGDLIRLTTVNRLRLLRHQLRFVAYLRSVSLFSQVQFYFPYTH